MIHWITTFRIGLLFDFPNVQVTLTYSLLLIAFWMSTFVGGSGGPGEDEKKVWSHLLITVEQKSLKFHLCHEFIDRLRESLVLHKYNQLVGGRSCLSHHHLAKQYQGSFVSVPLPNLLRSRYLGRHVNASR